MDRNLDGFHLSLVRPLLQTLVGCGAPAPNGMAAVIEKKAPALAKWMVTQGIGPLAYQRCRHLYPALVDHLRSDAYSATAENSLHLVNMCRILERLHADNITAVLLKGVALAESAYGDAALRTMSDVDIWLRPEDMRRAVEHMQQLGFVTTQRAERPLAWQMLANGELKFWNPKWVHGMIEFHWSPFPGWWLKRTAAINDEAIWSRIQPVTLVGLPAHQLAVEDMIIHVAVHLAVGHQFAPTPVRSLLDIALISQTHPVNWQVMAERAREWRVGTAVWSVLNLMDQFVGTPDLESALAYLRPSRFRQRLLDRLVSTQSILAGEDLRNSRGRYLLLLLLVDRPRDMLRLIFRTLWPEPEWLLARYQGRQSRWHHFWRFMRYGQV